MQELPQNGGGERERNISENKSEENLSSGLRKVIVITKQAITLEKVPVPLIKCIIFC